MSKHSKRYRALAPKGPTKDTFPLATAVEKLKKFATTKFDQTVELHMRLGVDPKQADQIVRGSVVLPNGIGRTQRGVHGRGCGASRDLRLPAAREVDLEHVARAQVLVHSRDGVEEMPRVVLLRDQPESSGRDSPWCT